MNYADGSQTTPNAFFHKSLAYIAMKTAAPPGPKKSLMPGCGFEERQVYAKPPCGKPETVLAYLSRYTHRVAISNSRLVSCDQRGVIFKCKDFRNDRCAPYS